MAYRKKFFFVLLVNLFLCLTGIFFSSLEVYIGNMGEFTFPVRHVWWIILSLSVLVSVFLSCLESFLPEKAVLTLCALAIAVGICFYLQSMFMNSQLQELTGENVFFGAGTVKKNLALWVSVITVILLGSWLTQRFAGPGRLKEVFLLISAGLIIIQAAGLFSTAASVTETEKNKDLYLSTEKEFTLSAEKNVLYFILDTCDMEYVDAALAIDPDLFREFTGFVSYQNAISMYSRTYPSLPYLMTGEKCYFDIPYSEYLKRAYVNSGFLPDLDASGADIRLYTALSYLDSGAYQFVDNLQSYDSGSLDRVSVTKLLRAMLRLSGYREMPYLLKPYFSYTIDPINRNVLADPPEDYYTLTNNDFEFYERLRSNRVSADESIPSAFRLYHLFGPHPGCYMNAYAGYDPNASQVDAFRGDIYILNEYLRQLKDNGIYEQTTIIVTADHGNQNENEDLVLKSAPCCIMLLKRAGADSDDPIVFSEAPVSHEDLFATVLDGFDRDISSYSPPLYRHEVNEERSRTYYYTAQRSWGDGEVALKEYTISGDARELSNWKLTGKVWDIRYSMNAVSKNKE